MENHTVNRRKRRLYIINQKFQSQFISKFCMLVVAGGLLTVGILYFIAGRSMTVAILNSRVMVKTTADFILPILIQTVAIVTIMVGTMTVFVTLIISHRIAGPLYRFKKVLKDLEQGDFSSDFRIRQLDYLQDLSDEFNAMIKRMRQELGQIKTSIVSLKDKLENLPEGDVSESRRSALSELKRLSSELNKLTQRFKT